MFRTFTSLSSTWTASLPPSAPSLRAEATSDACGTFPNTDRQDFIDFIDLFCGARPAFTINPSVPDL